MAEDIPTRIRPIVLAGGAGTRLWPYSTQVRPKFLLPLLGETTLLEQTLDRVADGDRFDRAMIVCNEMQVEAIADVAPGCRLLVEPDARNSAPAIALAAHHAEPDKLLLVLPSDHHIADPGALLDAVERARPVAEHGRIITFGITPDYPETGYGYISAGAPLRGGVFEVARFLEKPDLSTAERLVSEGGHYWNGGIFLAKASVLLSELDRYAPDISRTAGQAIQAAQARGDRIYPDSQALSRCPAISIDYAVLERSDRVAVVPVTMGWSDIGNWSTLYDFAAKDEDKNAADRNSAAIDSRGCLIRSSGPRIVALAVEDLVIIATPENVLVTTRAGAQRVREAAEAVSRRTD